MKCVNNKCNNDPLKSINSVVVNIDGDLACCEYCRKEYEIQKSKFFNTIIYDEKKCEKWLLGDE